MKTPISKNATRSLILALAVAAFLVAIVSPAEAAGRWVSGDINTHSYLADGKKPFGDVVRNAFSVYGLDYLANSEPGGKSAVSPNGVNFVTPVWRWITLSNASYPMVQDARGTYPERCVIQGEEWNAPTHETASVGIVGAENEPGGISAFEYRFDAADTDTSRAGEGTVAVKDPATGAIIFLAVDFSKLNVTNDNMLAGIDWLQETYADQAYAIVDAPSHKNLWHVGDFRAMNDLAPDVAFGFEGLPGHQATQARGDYGLYIAADGKVTSNAALADPTLTSHARTYGGADWMTATVGGVWDSLLGEGRHWWVFNDSAFRTANSSFADKDGNTIGLSFRDFWPGQYAKTWTHVSKFTNAGLVNGMRSGHVFVANGDLIDALKFTVTDKSRATTMGGTLHTSAGKNVIVTVAVRSPKVNTNGNPVRLNHIDVIAGDVTGPIFAQVNGAADPAYTQTDTNASAKVVKTFTAADWKVVKGGKVMSFRVKATRNMYIRLRGTNLAPGTANQTDAQGNPLVDELDYIDFPNPADGGIKADGTPDMVHGNTPDNAWADLWFYANPIFVNVK